MDKNNSVNITLPEGYKGEPVVVHLLEGSAPEVINHQSAGFKGDINAVQAYVTTQTPGKESIIVMDMEAGCITLTTSPNRTMGTTVEAKLSESDVMAKFGVNTDKKYSLEELRKLVRLNGPYFDGEEHRNLLIKLHEFKATITQQLNDDKDNRGNSKKLTDRKVDTDVPFKFKLSCPIYKGAQSSTFSVDVCIDFTDAGARFWMESAELTLLQVQIKEMVFADQKAKFDELAYTVIVKS